jgi:hypothetical protein
MDLLATYTHHSELQYNAIANLHTLQITAATGKHSPAFCVFSSRPLATASNSGDPSVSRAQVLSSQPPV